MSDHIERTELANIEYRAKTGEVLGDIVNEDGINMDLLASAFFRAVRTDQGMDIEAIKKYLWSKQTWRQS